MRKLIIAVALVGAVAGFAFANSLAVPFFLDDGNAGVYPTQGNASGFIGVVNTSTVDLVVSVLYVSPDSTGTPTDRTPNPNTFLLPANATVSWRPGTIDPSVETEPNGAPNMTGARDVTGGAFPAVTETLAGSATIYWPGVGQGGADERAVKGRYAQNNANGSSFAYFLGEGRTN